MDAIYYNSIYHLKAFFAELPRMLKHFADYNELQTVNELRQKAAVLPLGVDLQRKEFIVAVVVDTAPLQKNIAQFDWATLVHTYDKALSRLAAVH